MKIAQVAPLYESCPPRLYGGTERVVSYLTEELVRRGHQVTLFASGDSETAAELRSACPRALRLIDGYDLSLPYHLVMLHRVMKAVEEFDVVHFHTDYLHFPLFGGYRHKIVTTLHGRLDLAGLPVIHQEFPGMPMVSISDSQREPLPWLDWRATVHHGLPTDAYTPGAGGGGYLAFLGRICPEKRPDRAIEIARRVGLPLMIAAKVDKADEAYFEQVVRPLLDGPLVEYVGEVGEAEKEAFLGEAAALLFPIDWPEPFGLVLIEAIACGTPVVAWRNGSVAEVIDDGVTGFVVEDQAGAVSAVERALRLDRTAVRRRFEERFSAERMARDYLEVYATLGADIAYDLAGGAKARRSNFVPPVSAA